MTMTSGSYRRRAPASDRRYRRRSLWPPAVTDALFCAFVLFSFSGLSCYDDDDDCHNHTVCCGGITVIRHCHSGGHSSHLHDGLDLSSQVMVLSQLFYDADLFLRFVEDCRRIGIECPIIPGIMPIHNYHTFTRVTRFCRTVPKRVLEAIEPIRNDDAAIKDYGVALLAEICQKLLDAGIPGLHFYTMNLEQQVTRILNEIGVVPEKIERLLPWRSSANVYRSDEDVRPIFWANRPKSYLARTMSAPASAIPRGTSKPRATRKTSSS